MKTRDAVVYVGLGIAAIWLYQKFKGGINQAVNAVTQPIANSIVSLTSPPPPTPQGSVIFPDGTYIPVSSIAPNWVGNSLQFQYNGQTFALASHDANGNYPATVVQ